MFKWITLIFLIYAGIGLYLAHSSAYVPISQQIDVKTMSLHRPNYIFSSHSKCTGDCTNNSSSSSSWGGGGGGK